VVDCAPSNLFDLPDNQGHHQPASRFHIGSLPQDNQGLLHDNHGESGRSVRYGK
jgi:hypothetical protein